MKSERRHELETNQLADMLARIPALWHQHGRWILLGAVFVALVIALIFNRVHSKKLEAQLATEQLAAAREGIGRLQNFEPLSPAVPAADRALLFNNLVDGIRQNLDGTAGYFDEPAMLAEALVARGDLNWIIANYPELADGENAPAVPTDEQRATALEEARTAYERILGNYPNITMAALSARMGLAAIAENRGDWDAARQQYEAVASDEAFPESFRQEARQRLETLDKVRKPVLLVEARPPVMEASTAAPTTAPTTAPVIEPEPLPATAPTTAPAVE